MQTAILITNLDYVTLEPVRTFTHALLLEMDTAERCPMPTKLRGFATTGSTPTFDVFLKSIAHEFRLPFSTGATELGEPVEVVDGLLSDNHPTPVLRLLEDSLDFRLVTMNRECPLDVQKFEGEELYPAIWDTLLRKVAQYWRSPNMPLPQWERADSVRAKLTQI